MTRRKLPRSVRAFAVATILLVLAGCNKASGQPDGIARQVPSTPPTTAPTASTSSTAAVGDPTHQAVIDGWTEAENTIAQVELSGNTNDPMIVRTMVDPQLSHLIGYVSIVRATGRRFTGSLGLGHPVVTAFSPTEATVHSCLDGNLIVVDSTGRPISTSDGQHTWDDSTATMVPGPSGIWVMKSGSVKTTPWSASTTCPA